MKLFSDIAMVTEMTIGTEIIGGEVAVGAEKGLQEIGPQEIGIVGETGITAAEAGVTVEARTTAEMMLKASMMMRDEAEAGHMEGTMLNFVFTN